MPELACKELRHKLFSPSSRNSFQEPQRPNINCSKDAYNVLFENWDGSQIELLEQFKVTEPSQQGPGPL